ncbi:MAG: CsgG/HfaB family protein [Salinivirgaceae bacterium]
MISFRWKPYWILMLSLLLLTGCGSRRYAKKGLEFEKAGFYEKAADMYYISAVKNPKNLKAQVGLKKNGQITLDNKLEAFMGFYNADDIKNAVYKYVESVAFYEKVKGTGIVLDFPEGYNDNYQEVKTLYLDRRYKEAYAQIDLEKFAQAEEILNEILTLQPGYQNAEELKNTAHYEPIYRSAKDFLAIEKYRSSYLKFQEILSKLPNYKDSKELSDLALSKALITIAVVNFSNRTNQKGIESLLQSRIEKLITETKSPFIKLVDRSNSQQILREQVLAMEGKVDDPNSFKQGKMLGVKALLTGEVKQYNINISQVEKVEKKGFIKEVIKAKDGFKDSVIYKKTQYFEYSQSNSLFCHFQFKLISAETGEVMVSDALSVETSDRISYATYEGNKANLVPGYWEFKDEPSKNDLIKDDLIEKNKLNEQMVSRRQLKTLDALSLEVQKSISHQVVLKIEKYDPER